MYRWFIAYKHVLSRLVTFAALMAVTLSVAVLIVVVSVMEGFRSEIQDRVRGTTSDIRLTGTRYIGLKDPASVAKLVEGVEGVKHVTPFVESLVLYRAERWAMRQVAEDRAFFAFDLKNQHSVAELNQYVENVEQPPAPNILGEEERRRTEALFAALPKDVETYFSDEWLNKGLWEARRKLFGGRTLRPQKTYPAVLAGVESFRRELLLPGDLIKLTSISPTTQLPRTQHFLVAGYFKTGDYEPDSKGIISGIDQSDRFLKLRGKDNTLQVSGLRVVVDDDRRTGEALIETRERIESALDAAKVLFVNAQTWREAKSSLLNALQVEKFLVSIILGVVVLFSGFMIFIILTVQVVDKMRDIGVLQSLGATSRGIAAIFFTIGSSLCLVGTILGVAYGVAFALSINTIQRWVKLLTGKEVFPQDVYYLDHLPVVFRPEDLAYIIALTLIASLLASVVPAIRASRRDPAEVLRCG